MRVVEVFPIWARGFFTLLSIFLVTRLDAAVIVQLRVVEGEGAVYAVGSRAARGITVQVTDEAGKPVEGASVSFRLPDQGPGGTFSSGLRSEVQTTGPDGRAAIWGMLWNKTPGPFEVRITAIKDQARAGIVSTQYLSDAISQSGGSGTFQPAHHRLKWFIIGGAVLAAAAGGMFAERTLHSQQSPECTISQYTTVCPAVAATPPTLIGTPTISIGSHP